MDLSNCNVKLLVLGHGRHGKDTVSEIIAKKYNLSFVSSSWFLSENIMFNALKDKYGYNDPLECYNDRHNHRKEWFDLIVDYCREDKAKLGRAIFNEYDIYCGLRNIEEFEQLAPLITSSIWVDRSMFLPPESKESMNIPMERADYIVDNNGSLEALYNNVEKTMNEIIGDINDTRIKKSR